MRLEIGTDEQKLEYELFGANKLSEGDQIHPAEGVKVKYDGTLVMAAFDAPGFSVVIHLIVDISKDVGIGLFTAWLYDKLKNKNVRLKIDGRETEIDKSKIEDRVNDSMKKAG